MENEIKELKADFVSVTSRISKLLENLSDADINKINETAEEAEKKQIAEFVRKRFENCGIGTEYYKCSFVNYVIQDAEQKKMLDYGKQFCEGVKNGKPRNLILSGNCGIGKTHIAVSILKELAGYVKRYVYDQPEYCRIKYATVADIAEEFQQSAGFGATVTGSKILDEYAKYDVLVLDEVGRCDNKLVKESEMLFRLLDKRYQAGKGTVLLTNLTQKELWCFLGKACLSRLVADGKLIFNENRNIKDWRANSER